MAEVVGSFVVGKALDGGVLHVTDVREHSRDVEELDGALGQRVQLGLARRHRDAVLRLETDPMPAPASMIVYPQWSNE